jgi:hypothetical protein
MNSMFCTVQVFQYGTYTGFSPFLPHFILAGQNSQGDLLGAWNRSRFREESRQSV